MNISVNARFLTQRTTGVQRYAREITARLPFVEGVSSVTPIAPRMTAHDFPMEPRMVGRLSGHLWEQLELPRFIPATSDLLWSPCNVGPVAVRSHVVTIHDLFSITRPQWVSKAFRTWYSILLPVLARRASRVITVSEWSKREIISHLGIADRKVRVIPEGVDFRFSPPSSEDVARVKKKLELPDEYILTLGSLEPRKNLERVVRGWDSSSVGRDLPLLIAGGLGSKRVFGQHDAVSVLESPGVRRLGYVSDEDLPMVIGGATLLVYAALEEGFGLPPIEALACGTEVLTSNTSAMAEYCGDYCELVEPTSVESISEGIDRALAGLPDSPTRLIRAAEIRRRFDWTKAAAATVDVFREL